MKTRSLALKREGLVLKREQNAKRKKIAQSATELAIFGGMLVFLIGSIVRTGLNASLQMNAALRTLRIALSESYRTSEGEYLHFRNYSNARNSASIFVVEDRLMVSGASKYGAQDRAPFYAMATATMSHNLFDTMDYSENDYADIPIMDVFINDQRFPIAMGGFKQVFLNESFLPVCPNRAKPPDDPPPYGICWDRDRYYYPEDRPQAILFTVVGNYPASELWCDGLSGDCGDFSADQRFDLDFDGDPDVIGPLRQKFFWQWFAVKGRNAGKDDTISVQKEKNNLIDADGDYHQETVLIAGGPEGGRTTFLKVYDPGEGDMDVSLDARDPGEWQRVEAVDGGCGATPRGSCFITSPPAEITGDYMGQCYLWRCKKKKIGLMDDMQMYSFTTPGGGQPKTYLVVREGQLFNPQNGQFIRSTNRHDQLDIIERRYRLNKDTGRFCTSPPNLPGPTDWTIKPWVNGLEGLKNPVEACNNCYSPENVSKTCMDQANLTILVRSRIQDIRRRRWTRRYAP
jgi:hypothetical protein